MSGPHRVRCAISLVAVLLAASLAGCIQSDGGGGDGADEGGATLVIDFEGFEPDTLPGKEATWTPDGEGGWTLVSETTGGDTVYTVHNVTGTSVLDLLLEACGASGIEVEHHTEPMGAFVDIIDGVENGRDDHHWSYYVNGEYGTVAADRATVEDGDVVRWVYMGNPFG